MKTWYKHPQGDDGDVFKAGDIHEDWLRQSIGPDDGSGYWATDTEYNWLATLFSQGRLTQRPVWATHIVWFNK